jgi:hypothetical protein
LRDSRNTGHGSDIVYLTTALMSIFGFLSGRSEPKTHIFKGKFGDDYSVTTVYGGGKSIQLIGWKYGISKDDYLILNWKDKTTRYQVTEIKYSRHPFNMFTATAIFAPRDKTI